MERQNVIKIGAYLLYTSDKALAADAAVELNRRAEVKALPHKGYVVVGGQQITYELHHPPEQSRAV